MGIKNDGIPILMKLCIPCEDALKIKKKLKDEGKDNVISPSEWHDIVEAMKIQSGIHNA